MNPGGAADVAEDDQKIQLFIHAFNQIKEVPRPQRGRVKLAGSGGRIIRMRIAGMVWDGGMDQDGSRWIDWGFLGELLWSVVSIGVDLTHNPDDMQTNAAPKRHIQIPKSSQIPIYSFPNRNPSISVVHGCVYR